MFLAALQHVKSNIPSINNHIHVKSIVWPISGNFNETLYIYAIDDKVLEIFISKLDLDDCGTVRHVYFIKFRSIFI